MQHAMLSLALLSLLGMLSHAMAFDLNKNGNLAVYWGQGANQKPLADYCADDTIDVIPLAFLTSFTGTGGLPALNFGNACGGTFPGTELLQCNTIAADIKTCQNNGKAILLSLGGAATGNVAFTSDASATAFADLIWNLFLGGSSATRPFGSVKLDGVDLDIESGTGAHFAAFVTELRSKFSADSSKSYYVTAAPQCPLPDQAIGAALTAAHFDAVFVQFYNNYCGLNAPSQFNMAAWDTWAKTESFNKDVKVFIGAPGSQSSAGTGYVDAATLATITQNAQKQYSSMGGVMLWDAVTAYNNNRFDKAIKQAMSGSGGSSGAGSSAAPSSTKSVASASTKTAVSASTDAAASSTSSSRAAHQSSSSSFGVTVRIGDGPSTTASVKSTASPSSPVHSTASASTSESTAASTTAKASASSHASATTSRSRSSTPTGSCSSKKMKRTHRRTAHQ